MVYARPGCIVAPACGIFGDVAPLRASDFVVAPPPCTRGSVCGYPNTAAPLICFVGHATRPG